MQLQSAFTSVVSLEYTATPVDGSERLEVVGYPGDKEKDGEKGAQMWKEDRDVKWSLEKADGNMLEYTISTYAGMQNWHN